NGPQRRVGCESSSRQERPHHTEECPRDRLLLPRTSEHDGKDPGHGQIGPFVQRSFNLQELTSNGFGPAPRKRPQTVFPAIQASIKMIQITGNGSSTFAEPQSKRSLCSTDRSGSACR